MKKYLETMRFLKTSMGHAEGLHHVTEEELAKLQDITYEIMMDIVGICEEKGIPYMLGGGTALGAVRHQDFIPWDDDIDLNMERKYLPLLLREVRRKYKDKYDIMEPCKGEHYYSSFVQIRKKGTLCREYLFQPEEESGIKIDIFLIENVFDNPLARKAQGTLSDLLLFLLSCCRMHLFEEEFLHLSEKDEQACRAIKRKSRIGAPFARHYRFWERMTQKALSMCKNPESKYISMPTGRRHFWGELYPRTEFLRTVPMPFREAELPVTLIYEEYLTNLYGDYKKIPPEERRERHIVYQLRM